MIGQLAIALTTKVTAFVIGFMIGQFTLFFGLDARLPLYMLGVPVCDDYHDLLANVKNMGMNVKFIGFKRLADMSGLVIFQDEYARWVAFNVYSLPNAPACVIGHGGW